MIIKNAKIYRDGAFSTGSVSFGSRIEGFGAEGEGFDAKGMYLVPGFIDVHTHGALGYDGTDVEAEDIPAMAAHYSSHGVTSFLFTTMTAARDTLKLAMSRVKGYERQGAQAKIAGVHLEGPFLSYKKRGAQAAFNLQAPNIEMFHELNEISGGKLRIITVAPEIDGALDFIREASMEALHHRKPGLVGAAFMAGANVELICDGLHIHPAVIMGMHKMFGDRLIIISDSLRCAGLSDGHYDLAGQEIVVTDGKATLLDGTIAGSSSNLHEELKNVVSYGMKLEDAIKAMTETPAKAIGEFDSIGSLDIGKAADMLLLDEDLEIRAVIIDGEVVVGQL